MTESLLRVKGDVNRHIYKRGNIYWVRYSKSGKKPLQESLLTENLTDARIKRDLAIAKYLGKKARFQGVSLVCERFEEWIELKSTTSDATIKSIKAQWKLHLKEYFGNMHLDEVTESEWLKYVSWKRAQFYWRHKKRVSHKNRKFFNDRKYLSMFLNWCHREGYIEKLPKLPVVDPEIKAGKVYSEEEISNLFLHAELNLHLQIEMALTMGMRIGEIMSLEFDQINFKTEVIYLPAEKTKIRQERSFIASEDCLNELRRRLATSTSPFVFPSPKSPLRGAGKWGNKSAWKLCKKRAGVTGRFHDLRHTFLTRAFKESVNPALICHYAGLSLEEAQKTYLHFSIEDTRAVAQLVRVNK